MVRPVAPGDKRARPRAARVLATAGVVTLALGGISTLAPGLGGASSHREAPLIAGDPRVDNTDVYAFVSPDKADTVTLVANWIPFEEPNGGPNFYPFATDARYNINVDNNGDGKADVAYSWVFTDHYRDDADQFLYNTGPVKSLDDPNLNFYQTYTLTLTVGAESKELVKEAIAAPSLTGPASVPDYTPLRDQAIKAIPGGGQTFVGQADDSFFLDLRVFDLLYGTNLKEVGQDSLAGYNVNTIALQVPKAELAAKRDATANPVIGVWSTTERKGENVAGGGAAGFKQVSRLGNPLVNEVVVPLKFRDAFNGLTPDKDRTVQPVVDKVLDPIVPKLVEKIYNVPAPATPRNDLFEIFLTGICKECKAPDGNVALPIDLNSQMLNQDGLKGGDFVPAEELRLNMGVAPSANPNRLGVLAKDLAGYPNGRRLTDDALDITLQAAEGAAQTGELVKALAKGDAVDGNDLAFGSKFPYVALPHSDGVNVKNSQARTGSVSTQSAPASATPVGGVAAGFGGAAGDSSLPFLPLSAAVAGVFFAGAGVMTMRRRLTSGA